MQKIKKLLVGKEFKNLIFFYQYSLILIALVFKHEFNSLSNETKSFLFML